MHMHMRQSACGTGGVPLVMGLTLTPTPTLTLALVLALAPTLTQVHTLSTRMGKRGKLIFTADPNQADRKAANWASTGLLGYATRRIYI